LSELANVDERLTLPDGRVVGWANYGDPDGSPVIAAHGSPDSRVIWRLLDACARRHGVRIIAIDRPGFGISDAQPGRTVLDWPADVIAVADHLGVDTFPLVAISGGAAYAAATAWKHPDRVTGLGLFSVIGPLDQPDTLRGANRSVRSTYWMARRAPWLLRPIATAMARGARRNPERTASQVERTRPEEDRVVIARPKVRAVLMDNLPNQFRNPATVLHEFRLAVQPWGFPLEEITVPTHIWQGGRDDVHTPAMAHQLATTIPGAELTLEPAYSTFTFLDHLDPIVATLAAWAK
jgi:pimeloyl-ACP methyl ester carboxylesterase